MSRTLGRDIVARPPGVIDTLTAGYETVNRRLWLLLFPVGLDLLFWLGPKLSIVRVAGLLPHGTLESEPLSVLTESLAHFNLAFLLALYIPTVLGKAPYIGVPPELSQAVPHQVYQVVPAAMAPAVALLLPVGLLLTALYFAGIAQLVRPVRPGRRGESEASGGPGEPDGPPTGLLRVGLRSWWRMVVLHAAAAAALLALLLPLLVAIAFGALVSGELAAFLLLLLQVGLLWLAFYFFFALAAVVLNDAGPIRAALSSVAVIRSSFWSATGLIGLILIIGTGLPMVWRALATEPLGLVVSILGNAYVGTGLVAATMLYYRDRIALLRGQTVGNI